MVTPRDEPAFPQQWYLDNRGQTGGTPGVDINIRPAWRLADGSGVSVAINDSGIATDNPDLSPNLNRAASANFTGTDSGIGPNPAFPAAWHGTGVAAMAAAADNGSGFVGAAPGAGIAMLAGDAIAPKAEAPAGTYCWVLNLDR